MGGKSGGGGGKSGGGKSGGGGGRDVVSITLPRDTAEELLQALAMALGQDISKKKKPKK